MSFNDAMLRDWNQKRKAKYNACMHGNCITVVITMQ